MTDQVITRRVGNTERLWLTEPERKTAITQVTATRRDAFQLARSLYCPRSSWYRHPQDPDRGVVWTDDGEKRKLVSVFEDSAGIWHRLRDKVPNVDAELRCHLDPERRDTTSRAHTALHLLLEHLATNPSITLSGAEVKGGGTFRLDLGVPYLEPKALQAAFQHVRARIEADLPLRAEPIARDAAKHRVHAMPWDDGETIPGPEHSLDVIFVGDDERGIPCDGTFVARTSQVGDVRIEHAHPNKRGGYVIVGKVL